MLLASLLFFSIVIGVILALEYFFIYKPEQENDKK